MVNQDQAMENENDLLLHSPQERRPELSSGPSFGAGDRSHGFRLRIRHRRNEGYRSVSSLESHLGHGKGF
jgi:hypothetical protein